jgi:beta-lactamase class A
LLNQQVNDRIPSLLPSNATVAHKTGELPGVRNDAGIVRCPGSQYIIVTMSREGDPAEEIPIEARISRMVYDEYCG